MNLWQRLSIVVGVAALVGAGVLAIVPTSGTVRIPGEPGAPAQPAVTVDVQAECGPRPEPFTGRAAVTWDRCANQAMNRERAGSPAVPPVPARNMTIDCGSLVSTETPRRPVERAACDRATDSRRNVALGLGAGGVLVAVAGGLLLGAVPRRRAEA